MLIVCPSCASSYSLTAEQLGAGRMLRCATCRHKWFAEPADPDAPNDDVQAAVDPGALPALPADADAPLRQTVKKRPRPAKRPLVTRRRAWPKPGALFFTVLALGLLAGGAVVKRAALVTIVPQAAPLFALMGLPVNARGLEFSQIRADLVNDKDQPVLVVEGEVRGVAPGSAPVPTLQITLRDQKGATVSEWVSGPPAVALGPGEVAAFRTQLAAPPADGHSVSVRFTERDFRVAGR